MVGRGFPFSPGQWSSLLTNMCSRYLEARDSLSPEEAEAISQFLRQSVQFIEQCIRFRILEVTPRESHSCTSTQTLPASHTPTGDVFLDDPRETASISAKTDSSVVALVGSAGKIESRPISARCPSARGSFERLSC